MSGSTQRPDIKHLSSILIVAGLFGGLSAAQTASSSPEQDLGAFFQRFKSVAGQTFYLDLDSPPGVFSQWRHDDLVSLDGLQATLTVPRLRKDSKWRPTFTIALTNSEKLGTDDVGLQLYAEDVRRPLKIRIVGNVAGAPMSEIPFRTVLKANEKLKVEISWAVPNLVIIRVGESESRSLSVAWRVNNVSILGSTGQVKIDPLVFGSFTR